MTALHGFLAGFADGYAGRARRRNQGAVYLRAYRRGVEARSRFENGGEDTAVLSVRGAR
ncbi:hypothetical protein Q9R08_04960 [Microbacterium sp. QXD-8]|uniref:Uncharacterized protein n=1 Tax=Microbacterium psychrotolerans TaxID=3068321 RepID=A0ABU0YYA5_9MICO|nr:hypothetical protein [Microbacterium sp. QXD-8]MDQ7877322.1 hypothetical protein [Microbacterium sp. QXD-8]